MDDEETLLLGKNARQNEKDSKTWDRFQDPPREVVPDSMVESKLYKFSIKALRFFAFIATFLWILCCAVISKGTLLFMTSQVSIGEAKPFCNELADSNRQYVVELPKTERVLWMWMLFFAYCVPQLAIFIRSFRICFFRQYQFPKLANLLLVCFVEGLTAVGSALLVYCVLPNMDVVKGAMLTNAYCLVPAIQDFFKGYGNKSWGAVTTEFILKGLAIACQITAFFVWPLVERKEVLWAIALSILLVSSGWWQNYHSWKYKEKEKDDDSPPTWWEDVTMTSIKFTNSRYFIYVIASVWKCFVFFCTMVVICFVEGDVNDLFDDLQLALRDHEITIKEIVPNINSDLSDLDAVIATGRDFTLMSDSWMPLWILMINVLTTYFCYGASKFASKIMIQKFSYALPVNLAVPVTVSALIGMSGNYIRDQCAYVETIPNYLFFDVAPLRDFATFLTEDSVWIWILWLLSQTWITRHLWTPNNDRASSTEKLFMRPMYDPFLIDQDLALNRRDDSMKIEVSPARKRIVDSDYIGNDEFDSGPDEKTRIYACGTMWHETKEEMMTFMKSILRMDDDQCARNITKKEFDKDLDNDYNLQTHILFDDAFVRYDDKPEPYLNQYVKDLISTVYEACDMVHSVKRKWNPPKKYTTPYGGRLEWILPGGSSLIAHLKDKARIRAKKRWSQVMYMYYLLGYKMRKNEIRETNTYILALDGDIDFQPSAVLLLVNKMRNNLEVGAACGRIHPVGSGPMVWFQNFEYAIGHWLQKATEHVIGCVLCSPGCFSLFRAKSLMNKNVMKKYTTESTEAHHFVQYDQGEDRWLCTLLLQSGARVEYSAASDAYTHAPEGFNEFYNQRRRWMPSTSANIMDLLMDHKHVCEVNNNISRLYIMYQGVMMVGSVLGPGTIFLMLIGAFVAAFQLDQWSSFLWNVIPIIFFMIICKWFKSDVQLFFAGLLSAIYGLVMMAVLVGVLLQIRNDGPFAPSSLFFFCIAAEMIIAALMHPKEFGCLMYGIIYYITVPSMYLLLVIYSIFNMNNVSWGTRETVIKTEDPNASKETQNEKKKNRVWSILGDASDSNSGTFELSFAGLFKCFMCTNNDLSREEEKLLDIKNSIEEIQVKLGIKERTENTPEMVAKEEKKKENKREADLTVWMDDKSLKNSETDGIDAREEQFWERMIKKYLKPDVLDDNSPEKKRTNQALLDLRDKCVNAFFMINALYVLVVFLLTLKKDELHVKWPLSPKCNFTYNGDLEEIQIHIMYLQLEPIGLVFVVFFGILMSIQFVAMMKHRILTFCEILADTELTFRIKSCCKKNDESKKIQTSSDLTGEFGVVTVKGYQKLQNPNEEVMEEWKNVTNLRDAFEMRKRDEAKGLKKTIVGLPQKNIKRFRATIIAQSAKRPTTNTTNGPDAVVVLSEDVAKTERPNNRDDFAMTRAAAIMRQSSEDHSHNNNTPSGAFENIPLERD